MMRMRFLLLKSLRYSLAPLVPVLMVACHAPKSKPVAAVPPAVPSPAPAALFARLSEVPQTTAWLLMSTPAMRPAVVSAREDVTVRDRGWWRAGDGSISVRVRRDFWRTLPQYESGGVLVVEGAPGQQVQMDVKNHLGRKVEVVIDWNGADLKGQPGFPVERTGLVLAPGETKVVKPLALGSVADTAAMLRHQPTYQHGVARLTVYTSADKTRSKPLPTPSHATRTPQYQAQPHSRDYEYR